MVKSNWKLIISLGVVAVILVYFIALFATSFGQQVANNKIEKADFEVIKENELGNVHVGDVYMTLNWNEFSDVVVVQVGNNADKTKDTLRKDYRYWYYIFNKNISGNLSLNGVFTHKFEYKFPWVRNDVYELFLNENKSSNKYDALTMLTHEFENIYTGNIVDVNKNKINAYRSLSLFGGANSGKFGEEFYFVKNSVSYLPADNDYRLYLNNAERYAPQLVDELYKIGITSDSIFGINENYFACFSNKYAKKAGDVSKGWVQFNMKISVDYKDYTLQKFDYDHLSTMYKAVKDYTYYVNP